MTADEERMTEVLTRLFGGLYAAAGLLWTDDHDADLAYIVATMFQALPYRPVEL